MSGRDHAIIAAYFFLFFFFTLVTGPRRSLSLKLSDMSLKYEAHVAGRDHAIIAAYDDPDHHLTPLHPNTVSTVLYVP